MLRSLVDAHQHRAGIIVLYISGSSGWPTTVFDTDKAVDPHHPSYPCSIATSKYIVIHNKNAGFDPKMRTNPALPALACTSEATRNPKPTSAVLPSNTNTTRTVAGCRYSHQPCLHRVESARSVAREKLARPPPRSAIPSADWLLPRRRKRDETVLAERGRTKGQGRSRVRSGLERLRDSRYQHAKKLPWTDPRAWALVCCVWVGKCPRSETRGDRSY